MTSRELLEWSFSIALTIGIVGVTAIMVLFSSWCVTWLVKLIMETLVDAQKDFEKLKKIRESKYE